MQFQFALLFCALFCLVASAESPVEIRSLIDSWQLARAVDAAHNLSLQSPHDGLVHATALDLQAEGMLKMGAPFKDIEAVVDESLAIKSRLAPGSATLASTLLLHGDLLFDNSNSKEALPIYQQALSIAESADDTLLLNALVRLMRIEAAGRDRKAFVASFERARVMALSKFGPDSRQLADVLYTGGGAWADLGDMGQSESLFGQSLAVYQRFAGRDSFDAVRCRVGIADTQVDRSLLKEAIATYEDSLPRFEQVFGMDSRKLISILHNLGRATRLLGQTERGLALQERALRISSSSYGPTHPRTLTTLSAITTILAESGEFARAKENYNRLLELQTQALGPEHYVVGALYYSMANLEQVMGDYPVALEHLALAQAIVTKSSGPKHPKLIDILVTRGYVEMKTRDFVSAKKDAAASMAIAREILKPDNPRFVVTLGVEGSILFAAGDRMAARDHLREALEGMQKIFGANSMRAAQTSYDLALAEQSLGDHQRALALFDQADQAWRKIYGDDYPLRAQPLAGKAASLIATGRSVESLEPALESARIRRVSISSVVQSTAEREALLYAGVDRDGLALALDVAPAKDVTPSQRQSIFDTLIRDRGVVLDEATTRRHLAQSSGSAAAVARQVASSKQMLARAVLIEDSKQYSQRVASLRQDVDRAERQLAQQNAAFRRDSATKQVGLKEVQDAVRPGTALVAYARGEKDYVAFVLAASGLSVKRIGAIREVDRLIAGWRAEIEREQQAMGRNRIRNYEAYRAAGIALRRAIWDPLSAAIVKSSRVVVVADGNLHLVNFGTLPTGQDGFLEESGPLLIPMSSERDLLTPRPPVVRAGEMLAVGNPAFSAQPKSPSRLITYRGAHPGCESFLKMRFDDLPEAALEARAVAALYSTQGRSNKQLIGSQASESAFRANAAGKQVIHIATHGFFLGEDCDQVAALRNNPLLRSGLIFAGANRRADSPPDQDDGVLTAEEVSTLDLEGTELVVLSGCDTGLGVNQTGEGVLGLRRAFQAAGARTLVTSLWAVVDSDARAWMLDFYRARFSRSLGNAESVRAASVARLHALRAAQQSVHPYHWGSFVPVGE